MVQDMGEQGLSVFNQVVHCLETGGYQYRIHDHPEVCTIEQAHALVPHLTVNLVKTIVFRIKNGHWVLAAVHKDHRIDYKKLAAALGVKRTELRSIAPEQVGGELGFEVGGVGPFAVRDDIQVVMDAGLKGLGNVFCGSGLNTRTVEVDIDCLMEISSALVYPIAKPLPGS